MSTPESIAEAFGRGLMQGMIGRATAAEKPVKEPKQKLTVAKTDDIDSAVQRYLDAKLDEEPVQEELFAPPGVDLGDELYRRRKVAEAEERAARNEAMVEGTDPPEGFFDANEPGAKAWTSAGNS